MEFIIVTFILLILELLYFRIADKFNIIDKPNHRSSHTQITLRGGGIIFPIAFVLYFVVSAAYRTDYFLPEDYWSFGLGLFLLSTISFLDDILDLSTKLRLVFQFLSVVLLIYSVPVFIVFLSGSILYFFWIRYTALA